MSLHGQTAFIAPDICWTFCSVRNIGSWSKIFEKMPYSWFEMPLLQALSLYIIDMKKYLKDSMNFGSNFPF